YRPDARGRGRRDDRGTCRAVASGGGMSDEEQLTALVLTALLELITDLMQAGLPLQELITPKTQAIMDMAVEHTLQLSNSNGLTLDQFREQLRECCCPRATKGEH